MSGALEPLRLLDPLFTTERMAAIFSERARVQGLLDFEAALARAEAQVGVIPASAVPAIVAQCRAELFDLAALAQGTALAGNLAIPLVRALTAQVAAQDQDAARYVHWGATSQDALDTGLVLQLEQALTAITADLDGLNAALARQVRAQQQTVMVGRTWLQQATPITLGLKLAGTLSALERHRQRLAELRPRLRVVQFGGASGTLAALGEQGLVVGAALAAELGLALPDCPWHSQRDRLVEVATVLGLLTGTLGKLAHDIALLMQTEVAEVFEPAAAGKGGSSTMPHKRNPVGCAAVLSAALRVPGLVSVLLTALVQEHERGLGNWHAEWETLPELVRLAAGALAQCRQMVVGLEVDPARMAVNLALTQGLILAEAVTMALAAAIGRQAAHHLIEQASRQAVAAGRPLRAVLAETAEVSRHLSASELDRLFDPAQYTGLATTLAERALAARDNPGE